MGSFYELDRFELSQVEHGRRTVTRLHPTLPLGGVSIVMERGCQQNDSFAAG